MSITAASLMVKVGADVSQAQRALSQMGQTIDNTARRATSFRQQWDGALQGIGQGALGGFAGGMGFGMITQGMSSAVGAIQGIVSEAAGAYMEYERLNMSLKAMSAQELVNAGSAKTFAEGLAMSGERAKELIEWNRELAIQSPYSSQDVAGLLRLGMVYGFNSEQAKRATKASTDFGAAMGLTGPDMERVIRALGQMNQRGKVSAQELNQLSEVGVAGLKILADAAGVSTAEMQKMIEQGVVPAGAAIEAIVSHMASFDGAAAANAGTLGGLLSSMQDLKEIGEIELFGPIFQQIQPKVAELVAEMSKPEFREGLNAFGTQLGAIAGAGIDTAANSITTAAGAIKTLLDTDSPPWLAGLGGLSTLMGGEVVVKPVLGPDMPGFEIPATAKVYEVLFDESKDYGVTVDATGKVTKTTVDLQNSDDGMGGKLVIDSVAGVTDFVWKAEGFGVTYDKATGLHMQIADATVNFVADWQEGTIGSLIAGLATDNPDEQRKILVNAGWSEGAIPGLQRALQSAQFATDASVTFGGATDFGAYMAGLTKDAIVLDAEWKAGIGATLFNAMQANFKEPLMLVGSWVWDTIPALWNAVQGWFTANPVNVTVNTTYSRNSSMTPAGMTPGYNPGADITLPGPEAYIDPVTGEVRYRASGDAYFAGGLAVVGEQGPELVNLPQGARIYNNRDTKRLLAMGIPGFAEGNATPPAPGAWLGQSSSFGAVGNLIGNAAGKQLDKAGKEFAKDVQSASNDFASSLRGVPGLFGASQVTGQQMKMAEMGVPQNFADDYLRRLSDEVINGVNWDNVDIKDAAAAAGIDPNLPAQAILEMFRGAWQDSSLFANPENLKFINTDAVKAAQQRSQDSEAGKANIMALFGVGEEELVSQIAGLGIQVQNGLSQYLTEQGLGPVGAQTAAGIGHGIAENGGEMGAGVVSGFGTWITSPDGLAATYNMGDSLAGATNAGYKGSIGKYDWTVPVSPPTGGAGAAGSGAATPFAAGTLSSPAGWALVGEQGPELVRLPGGARVYNANETASRAVPISMVINASVSQPHDIDLLARRVARAIQQKRG